MFAGILEKYEDIEYIFTYDETYYKDPNSYAISLSLSKEKREYRSKALFPFFYGLLSEGTNKEIQCRLLRIDENDHYSLLLSTAHSDTIGSVTVREVIS